ncbi:hypothetical protein GQ53DRAFT_748675 [Thozetella sp. PMI_491]|nr:hypothetical protein GQ53DRAFT_748675 [Thozetella sp. PMI_491]
MGRAEAGSLKALNNSMKAKGLNRLRWYCQLCQKSCRDENGFKMHCQSESHTKKALEAGRSGFTGVQEDFSQEFLKSFVQLLRTSHGEKEIHINKFYQEVIQDRHHTHLNSTKWHSLTDFAKHLGRESICRVEEKEDGIFIAWIDDSPEAMKRREALRRKEMQDKGDEEREQEILRAQIARANKAAEARGSKPAEGENEDRTLKRQEGEKISLSFGKKPALPTDEPPKLSAAQSQGEGEVVKSQATESAPKTEFGKQAGDGMDLPASEATKAPAKPLSLKFGGLSKPQPKNAFKNAFAGEKKKVMVAQPKKMSEAERIMKEEMERNERKRTRESGQGPSKKMRF